MSYGCAKRRDRRRAVAIQYLEGWIKGWQDRIDGMKRDLKEISKESDVDSLKAKHVKQIGVKDLTSKIPLFESTLQKARETLANTKRNLGQGTAGLAVARAARKAKKTDREKVDPVFATVDQQGNFTGGK